MPDQRRRTSAPDLEVEKLAVAVARLEERTAILESIEERVRSLESQTSSIRGAGRAGVQGVTWILPLVLAAVGLLVSVVTYVATRR